MPPRKTSSEFDSYCAIKDPGELRKAMRSRDIRLTLIALFRWFAPIAAVVVVGSAPLQDRIEKLVAKAGIVKESAISIPSSETPASAPKSMASADGSRQP